MASNTSIVFTGKDQVEVQELGVPEVEQGNLLIQTTRTLISTGTECIALQRKFSEGTNWHAWVKYPFFPGYCGVGRVHKAASDVTGFAVGNRVALWTHHRRYAQSLASRAVAIPDNVTDEEAAWMPMGVIAQHGFRHAKIELGETVVIVGMGILGQLTAQFARLSGAGEVIAIDPAKPRLDMALRHGATHALNLPVQEAAQAVMDITGKRGADVLFDITGHPAVFAASHKLMATFGRIVLTGDTGTPEQQHMTSDFMGKNLSLIGAHQSKAAMLPHWNHQRQGELFLKFIARGQINVRDLITHRFKVADAPQAYRMLTDRRDEAMGVVIEFE